MLRQPGAAGAREDARCPPSRATAGRSGTPGERWRARRRARARAGGPPCCAVGRCRRGDPRQHARARVVRPRGGTGRSSSSPSRCSISSVNPRSSCRSRPCGRAADWAPAAPGRGALPLRLGGGAGTPAPARAIRSVAAELLAVPCRNTQCRVAWAWRPAATGTSSESWSAGRPRGFHDEDGNRRRYSEIRSRERRPDQLRQLCASCGDELGVGAPPHPRPTPRPGSPAVRHDRQTSSKNRALSATCASKSGSTARPADRLDRHTGSHAPSRITPTGEM